MFLSPGSRAKPHFLAPVAGIGTAISRLVTGYKVSVRLTTLTGTTSSDIALNNTGLFFDGPSVAQGSSGVFFAVGSVVVNSGSAAADLIVMKLWDGTTVFGDSKFSLPATGSANGGFVAGIITNPVGNIRVSVNDASSVLGTLLFNNTGLGKDSTVTVMRIG